MSEVRRERDREKERKRAEDSVESMKERGK